MLHKGGKKFHIINQRKSVGKPLKNGRIAHFFDFVIESLQTIYSDEKIKFTQYFVFLH